MSIDFLALRAFINKKLEYNPIENTENPWYDKSAIR